MGHYFSYHSVQSIKKNKQLNVTHFHLKYNKTSKNQHPPHSNFTFSFCRIRSNQFSSIPKILTYNVTSQSGLLQEPINSNIPIIIQPGIIPNILDTLNFQILLTDYTSYAFLDVCQNINGVAQEFVIVLMRRLTLQEFTIFPLLGTIFDTFFSLTSYTGGQMQYVSHDQGLCQGL